MVDEDALVAAATDARLRARAPFSRFLVGAAVVGDSGRVWTGCNVESASYSLTCCAERVALFKAVSEGDTGFHTIVVVTDAEPAVGPCGACRQVIHELAPGATVVVASLGGQRWRQSITALLPGAFDASSLPSSD